MSKTVVSYQSPQAASVAGKRYFYTLDAMRGIAAIGVVCLHLHPLLAPYDVPHGYLAVDLFFALSGLVISRANAERFHRGLTLGKFMFLRLERLYPLYILGSLIGAASLLLPYALHPELPTPWLVLSISGISALLMLPSHWPDGGKPWLMPLNIAAWSLVLELAVNFLYALCWRWLGRRGLPAVIVASGALLILVALANGNLDLGATWPTVAGGMVRTCFSFFVGVAIGRVSVAEVRISPIALLLPAILFLTLLAGNGGGVAYDLVCAMAIYPALLFMGARYEASGCEAIGAVGLRFLGTISYALYVLHGPVLVIANRLILKYGTRLALERHISAFAILCGLITLSALAEAYYDQPFRVRLALLREGLSGLRGARLKHSTQSG